MSARTGARAWMTAPVATAPSWAWAAAGALLLALCAAVFPPAAEMGRLPDRDLWDDPNHRYGDLGLFVRAGRTILSGDLGRAYSDATVQTGPLALVWAGGLAFLLHLVHASPTVGFILTSVATVTPGMYAATLWASRHQPARWLYAVAVGALVVVLLPWEIPTLIAYQHPTYVWVPALWLLAAAATRTGRWVVVALLLAAAAALETWAVLAVPVLLLALPTWRARACGGATWALAAAAVWSPFVLSGQFRMLDMTWTSSIASPVLSLWGNPATVTWEVRATQGLLVVAASVAAWLVGRSVTDAATVAVAVVPWIRLVTDTQWYPYYRLALIVTTVAVVLAAAAVYLRTRRREALVPLGLGLALVVLAQAEALPLPMAVSAALHVGLVAALVVSARALPAGPPAEDLALAPGSG